MPMTDWVTLEGYFISLSLVLGLGYFIYVNQNNPGQDD